MEQITRMYWEKCFENYFLRKKGTEFQTFFTQIMELRHPGDFTQIKPWGKTGDDKCDGWLASEKRLFQVYAPDKMERNKTEAKMEEDFTGALNNWVGRFEYWTFVHNSRNGVPPFVLHKTQAFRDAHPKIDFTPWGYSEIRSRLFQLTSVDIAVILGPVPTSEAMRSIRYDDVERVLRRIEIEQAPPGADLRPVPADKLRKNNLSDDVAVFLKLGMLKAPLVAQFFTQYPDPRYGDALAFRFKEKYLALKQQGLSPDKIFWELRGFAGATDATSDREQAAALAILAHLFEECDIFERPEKIVSNGGVL